MEDIRIDELADRFYFSKEYLTKLFLNQYGSAIYEYALLVRMNHELLGGCFQIFQYPSLRRAVRACPILLWRRDNGRGHALSFQQYKAKVEIHVSSAADHRERIAFRTLAISAG